MAPPSVNEELLRVNMSFIGVVPPIVVPPGAAKAVNAKHSASAVVILRRGSIPYARRAGMPRAEGRSRWIILGRVPVSLTPRSILLLVAVILFLIGAFGISLGAIGVTS